MKKYMFFVHASNSVKILQWQYLPFGSSPMTKRKTGTTERKPIESIESMERKENTMQRELFKKLFSDLHHGVVELINDETLAYASYLRAVL